MLDTARKPVQVWSRDEHGVIAPATFKVGRWQYNGPIFQGGDLATRFVDRFGTKGQTYILVQVTPPGVS